MNPVRKNSWDTKTTGGGVPLTELLSGRISPDRKPFSETQLVKAELIDPNPFQPRKNVADAEISDLVASIQDVGLLQPLLVTPNESRYTLIAGERRLTALRRLNTEYIPCLIRKLDSDELLRYSLIENLQREDLSALEEAVAIKLLIDSTGYSYRQVSELLGKSKSFVSDRLTLIKLPPDIEAAIENKDTSLKKAMALRDVSDIEDRKALIAGGKSIDLEGFKDAIQEITQNQSSIHPLSRRQIKRHAIGDQELLKQATNVSRSVKLYRDRLSLQFNTVEELKKLLMRVLTALGGS